MLASDIGTHAAKVYLNDSAQAVYTNELLVPLIAEAVLRLEQLLRINNIPFERKVSATIDVDAEDTELGSMPIDFLEPISMRERRRDSTDDWSDEIDEVDEVNPNNDQSQEVNQWSFNSGIISINPPTTDREVRLRYRATLTAVTGTNSTIDLVQSKSYLAAVTAQLAAQHIGNSPTKAAELQGDVNTTEDMLVRALVKNSQGQGVRRRGYTGRKT